MNRVVIVELIKEQKDMERKSMWKQQERTERMQQKQFT